MHKIHIFSLILLGFGLFLMPHHSVLASDTLFEISDNFLTSQSSWGRTDSQSGLEIAQRLVPINNPLNGVCQVSQRIAQSGSPSDDVVLEVYSVGFGGSTIPRQGIKVATAFLHGTTLPTDTTAYSTFHLSKCLNMPAGSFWWFIWSRSNPNSQGQYITKSSPFNVTFWTDYYWLDPIAGWSTKEFGEWSMRLETGTPATKEPVIIVPGTMGSRLNRASDGEEVWPNIIKMFKPGADDYLDDIKLSGDGITDANTEIAVGTIVDKVGPFGMYSQLIEKFVSSGYVLNQDLFIVTYDWRKDIATNNQALDDKVRTALTHSSTGKINLIGHSMGAMLLRDYLSKQSSLDFVDSAVFVAPSFLGGPETFKVFNYGDNLEFNLFGLGLNPSKTKEIAQNMPGIYELLPSTPYFDAAGGYVTDFRNGAHNILNPDETNAFMLSDTQLPDHRNPQLLEQSSQFHQRFDNTNLDGAHVYNIVGCGLNTVGGFRLYNKGKIDTGYVRGDGTVPVVSADHFAGQGTTYYVLPTVYKNHLNLTQNPIPQQLIADLVAGRDPGSLTGVTQDQTECKSSSKKNFLVATFSPVDLQVYDSHGNHTGLKPDGDIEFGIPDSDFFQLGENNFISLPEGDSYKIVVDAYASGSFDLKVREVDGGQVVQSVNFLAVPIVSSNLSAEMTLNGIGDFSTLDIDTDGNGTTDQTLQPNSVLTGDGNEDIVPPSIEISSPLSQTYTRSQIISVNVVITDDRSGVDFSVNKFDGQSLSFGPIDLFFSKLGSHTFETIAYDKAGNLGYKQIQFQSIATIDSTISDINRSYALGWISKESVKNSLIRKINRPVITGLLIELEREYNKGNITQSAYEIIKEDVLWLMSH